ncbi:hypothetical protein Hbl1158_07460 [Halobaculum sp. CBA1158]|uniref:hypothetical protein n=1 Tax=Halobaculum sp. CBA1158 TaxID=2904243 RepID=UPI001F263BC1|nr:hypothetical protein [Halobaculum sp. CBA1158]UIP01175.1 hypothetical protein Hbl1158_07460 [Halobaculum sp. CBA1158]
MTLIDSLPPRPLRSAELEALRDAERVTEAAPLGVDSAGRSPASSRTESGDDDAIRALAVQAGETIHGLAYDSESGWTVVESREAGDPEDLAAVRDALKSWEARRAAVGDGE